MELILASASPRRREILELAGYDFTVSVSDVEETLIDGTPGELVEHLSGLKARAVAGKYEKSRSSVLSDPCIVIGADTVVVEAGEILGKPQDEEDAFRMLRELSGETHQVFTGVTLCVIRNGIITDTVSFSERTDVTMREISDAEIRKYISTGEPMDKAGAYGIQGKAAIFISGIKGDYYNVVGLPICRLTEMLGRFTGDAPDQSAIQKHK